MAGQLELLGPDLQHNIISFLDVPSRSALSLTSGHFFDLLNRHQNHQMSIPPPLQPTQMAPLITGFDAISSLSSPVDSDNDTLASTDTEMSPSPEEDEWVLKQTLELTRRLSLLSQPKVDASLSNLPTELQLQIFAKLDKIDACCLGLSSPRLYGIFRAIHGTKVRLNVRRDGPNQFERAWEVVGGNTCRHCDIYRCELHAHIKTWMPKELEYCNMKQNFGLPADNDAKPSCFRGKPSKPHRCGRHPLRTTSMHQDDNTMSTIR